MHPRICAQNWLNVPQTQAPVPGSSAPNSDLVPQDPQIGDIQPKTTSVDTVIANHKMSHWLPKYGNDCVAYPTCRLLLAPCTMQRLPA